MKDDDDEAGFGGIYESGHWAWDESTEALVFISDLPPEQVETVQMTIKAPTGAVEFRDDIDLIEQLRYRRRYQRKLRPGQADLVTLQDIKDIAIYTAPVTILSPMLIEMLHVPTTERFLRALIFCCAYYLQVADEMSARLMEQASKVRTPDCDLLENEYRENLSDLRLLVAKEYSIMLIGGGDTQKFHHMGANKKRRSLSDRDARLFETFIRITVQIVYLALGRKNYPQIELECHRLLKSEIFNSVENTLKSGYISRMEPEERSVLLGHCLHHDKKLTTSSPLLNEVFCHRPVDFRLLGLGVINYTEISNRLHYLHLIVSGREEMLYEWSMSVGIIGMKRSLFDTMLRPIYQSAVDDKSKGSMSSRTGSSKSGALRKSTVQTIHRFYPEIVIPAKETYALSVPSDFPQVTEDIPHVSHIQRRRWLNRFIRLTKATAAH